MTSSPPVACTVGVCEDDPAIRQLLRRGLERAGHRVVVAHDGGEALRLLGPATLDAIVLDIGLPDADGRDVAQALRAAGQTAPVLFLTALGGLEDKLQAFAAGAEDYLVKPFALAELLARLEVLARRARPAPPAGAADADTGGVALDPAAHAVTGPDGTAVLSPTEYRMLAAILSRPGEVVRRRVVVAAAWPEGAIVAENTVDSYLRRIRGKLAEADASARIATVRGVGFRLERG
ncbi:response regulator transcription factor [Nocardioides sp.]|uniref:response regulator transcription factor n=1 Tax=Nocardioides sp. TaxID=35761 RepID=UPI0035121F8F